MIWSEIRNTYPNQWLLIEALEAKSTADHKRELQKIAVIERCENGGAAFQSYRRYHRQHPLREYYFVHTSREKLEIREQIWMGARFTHEAVSAL